MNAVVVHNTTINSSGTRNKYLDIFISKTKLYIRHRTIRYRHTVFTYYHQPCPKFD